MTVRDGGALNADGEGAACWIDQSDRCGAHDTTAAFTVIDPIRTRTASTGTKCTEACHPWSALMLRVILCLEPVEICLAHKRERVVGSPLGRGNESFGRGQRHLGVVGVTPRREAAPGVEIGDAIRPVRGADLVETHELDGGAERIADGEAKERTSAHHPLPFNRRTTNPPPTSVVQSSM